MRLKRLLSLAVLRSSTWAGSPYAATISFSFDTDSTQAQIGALYPAWQFLVPQRPIM
jgi:hypothetical protein